MVTFNSLSGSIAYARAKRIDYRSGVAFAVASIPGAAIGAITTTLMPRGLFETVFGVVLIAGGVFVGLKRPRPQTEIEKKTARPSLTLGIWISLAVGFFSSLLGVGGGIVHVPALTYILHFPVHIATATSTFVLTITAITATITHWSTGALSGNYHEILFLAIGAIAGAQTGAALSARIGGKWILRVLGIALIFVGIRILI
jgi:uncharacterized membrane protein YfcA